MTKKELERKILIKDSWCLYIIACLSDYDGYENSLDGLKSLIDEAIENLNRARVSDDISVISSDGENEYNILFEKLDKTEELEKGKGGQYGKKKRKFW